MMDLDRTVPIMDDVAESCDDAYRGALPLAGRAVVSLEMV